jgi:hypothetical protein
MTTEQLPHIELGSRAAPQSVPLAEIAQVLNHTEARYLAELRAQCAELRQVLRKELCQHGLATDGAPVAELPSEHAQQRPIAHVPAPVAPPPAQPQRRTRGERLEERTVHPFYWALLYVVFMLISLGLSLIAIQILP